MRFPLDLQKVGGYDYGVPTSYSQAHLGVDWRARYIPLYAPKSGKVIKTIANAPAGGNTMYFQPNGETTVIRWLHLDKFLVGPGVSVSEGEQLAVTGNTGKSDLPHLHEDIWPKGQVTLHFGDTTNPHNYYKQSSLTNDDMLRTYQGTIYALVAGYWVAVATSYQDFLTDFGNQSAPEMTEAQFKAFPVNKRTIK